MDNEIEQLSELKEIIEKFIIKNNIKEFEVHINKGMTVPTEIEINIKI